eukprot:CAMPEP_0184861194 /NCGR_PEP_ID=MMETSP0580-20130426/5952_1 /TAXON_ID=1118495 /ORGANISM="Dactyliosolen fragilissimus" /LENGTH=542 /DNA_ID=CAMNT_0027358615 /DNA_START=480 /DNA_END=2108 /DNA_ORIENTATION=+
MKRNANNKNNNRSLSSSLYANNNNNNNNESSAEFQQYTERLCAERNIPFDKIKNVRDLSSVPRRDAYTPKIRPNRVYRAGRMGDASERDIRILLKDLGIKTLVDLRSPTELRDDPVLDRPDVFGSFVDLIWSERRKGAVLELASGQSRIRTEEVVGGGVVDGESEGGEGAVHGEGVKKRTRVKRYLKNLVRGDSSNHDHVEEEEEHVSAVSADSSSSATVRKEPVVPLAIAADLAGLTSEEFDNDNDSSDDSNVLVVAADSGDIVVLDEDEEAVDMIMDDDDEEEDDDISSTIIDNDNTQVDKLAQSSNINNNNNNNKKKSSSRYANKYPPNAIFTDTNRSNRHERHFVSLMNELKYVRGTLSALRKRDIAKVILQSPGAIVSRRVRTNCYDTFINEINAGGLPMLNRLLLRFGAPGIRYVLQLCADTTRHPVAFFCTAGKDRTGVIAAIILSLCHIKDEDIVMDYGLSANVYAQMDDHTAMVGALSQRNLDPETFLGAPPSVMRSTLQIIDEDYGGVEAYCDYIGFDEDDRNRLREALLAE